MGEAAESPVCELEAGDGCQVSPVIPQGRPAPFPLGGDWGLGLRVRHAEALQIIL